MLEITRRELPAAAESTESADPGADDCNIYVQSRRAGALRQAQEGHGECRTPPDQPSQDEGQQSEKRGSAPMVRKFLGFSFTDEAEQRRRIAPQALTRFTSRVRVLTRRTVGASLEQAVARLSIYLTGWRG